MSSSVAAAATSSASAAASNYIEYVVCLENRVYNIEKTKFNTLLSSVQNQSKKGHTAKHLRFTRYIYKDLVYECSDSADVRTYRKTPLSLTVKQSDKDKDKDICIDIMQGNYSKEKIPFYMFPSTTGLYDVVDVQSSVFRVHNNVFINFETQRFTNSKDSTDVFKVFINYNVDPRDDAELVKTIIEKAVSTLLLQRVPTFETAR